MSHTPLIAVFPGQGAQFVGMGKNLHAEFKAVREIFEEASDAISVDLKKLCFDGPESDLVLTENTQPALLVTSFAAFQVARTELGFTPDAVAGHSLGEYSALVAAGSISLAQATRWVRARGQAMQKAVPPGEGTMAAVLNLEEAAIRELCSRATRLAKEKLGPQPNSAVECTVEPANFNAPGQIVVAGSTLAVETLISLAKTDADFKGAKALPLKVSAPFHCSLMRPARESMAALFRDTPPSMQPKAPLFPYLPNRTARLTSEPSVIFELLEEQIDHPVLWSQSVSCAISQHGARDFVEFGPGKVLQGLIKRIAPADSVRILTGVSDTDSLRALEATLKTAPKEGTSA